MRDKDGKVVHDPICPYPYHDIPDCYYCWLISLARRSERTEAEQKKDWSKE